MAAERTPSSVPGLPGPARLTPEAFARRLEASWGALWCLAVAVTGSRDEAEDIVQDAALVALTKLDQFDADTSFLAWMRRIVRYTSLNAGRRRVRRRALTTSLPRDDEHEPVARPPYEPPAVTSAGALCDDQRSFDDQMVWALRQLDETARACLLLRVVGGLPYREIALALDVREGTAMNHVHRARPALRRAIALRRAEASRARATTDRSDEPIRGGADDAGARGAPPAGRSGDEAP